MSFLDNEEKINFYFKNFLTTHQALLPKTLIVQIEEVQREKANSFLKKLSLFEQLDIYQENFFFKKGKEQTKAELSLTLLDKKEYLFFFNKKNKENNLYEVATQIFEELNKNFDTEYLLDDNTFVLNRFYLKNNIKDEEPFTPTQLARITNNGKKIGFKYDRIDNSETLLSFYDGFFRGNSYLKSVFIPSYREQNEEESLSQKEIINKKLKDFLNVVIKNKKWNFVSMLEHLENNGEKHTSYHENIALFSSSDSEFKEILGFKKIDSYVSSGLKFYMPDMFNICLKYEETEEDALIEKEISNEETIKYINKIIKEDIHKDEEVLEKIKKPIVEAEKQEDEKEDKSKKNPKKNKRKSP